MQSPLPPTTSILDGLPDEYLTARDICGLLRISRTALDNAYRLSNFPPPLRISKRALRWRKAEVANYLNRQGGSNG